VSRREAQGGLEVEIVGEKAHALGRIASRMERALVELRAFDDQEEPAADVARDDLVAAAAEWVWYYVVQRDVLGWHRHEDALRFYRVPAEVLARMGPRRR